MKPLRYSTGNSSGRTRRKPLRVAAAAVIVLVCLIAFADDREIADLYHEAGVKALKSGDTDKAVEQFRKALKRYPVHPDSVVRLGNIYSAGLDTSVLVGLYNGWLKAFRGLAQPTKKQIEVSEKLKGALGDLKKLENIEKKFSKKFLSLGRSLRRKDKDAAAEAYNVALVLDPGNTSAAREYKKLTGRTAETSKETVSGKVAGKVIGWGCNFDGEVGDGTIEHRLVPVRIPALNKIVDIAAGGRHSIALSKNGTVFAWGRNKEGQLGNGTTKWSSKPIKVPGLTKVIDVDAGYGHSLALKRDGAVWAWGENTYGQLGIGTTTNSLKPVKVKGLENIKAIAGGRLYSLALKEDGTVWVWGGETIGLLEDNVVNNQLLPVKVEGLGNVKAIAAGGLHRIALKKDGTVWGWGTNNVGQSGTGTRRINHLENIIQIAAGLECGFALQRDGTLWGFGWNGLGQLGDGTKELRQIPVNAGGLRNVKYMAAGSNSGLALTKDGAVWSWGWNRYGQLGNGKSGRQRFRVRPVRVIGLKDVIMLEGGADHAFAIVKK